METYYLTFKDIVILQNDAKACFDRIINSHSTLHSRRFDISDKICKIHSTTLRNTKYRVQTTLGIDQLTPSMDPNKVYDYPVLNGYSSVYR